MVIPIEFDGEIYLTAAEVAERLGISRETFYKRKIKQQLQQYQLGILKRTYYLQKDVDALRGIRRIDQGEETQ